MHDIAEELANAAAEASAEEAKGYVRAAVAQLAAVRAAAAAPAAEAAPAAAVQVGQPKQPERVYSFAAELGTVPSAELYMAAIDSTHQEEGWRKERKRLGRELLARGWHPPVRVRQPKRERQAAPASAKDSSGKKEKVAEQKSSREATARRAGAPVVRAAGSSSKQPESRSTTSSTSGESESEEDPREHRAPQRAPQVARKAASPVAPGLQVVPKAHHQRKAKQEHQ